MSLQLKQIEDARDPLMKLSRKECEHAARYYNVESVVPGMPQPLMVMELRKAGVALRSVTNRGLGAHRLPTPPYEDWVAMIEGKPAKPRIPQEAVEVSADELLRKEWESQRAKPLEDMHMHELRSEAKRRGLKVPRTTLKTDLLVMLDENPAE